MDKILVTGGAGYLGSLLLPCLLDGGRKVTLFDNFTFGVRPILHFAAHPHLEIIDGDVRDARTVSGQERRFFIGAIVGAQALFTGL